MMKKKLFFFLSFLYTCNLFSKDLEIVKIFKFNEPISYYEDSDSFEGHSCGISKLFFFQNSLYIFDYGSQIIYEAENMKNFTKADKSIDFLYLEASEDFLFYGTQRENSNFFLNIDNKELENPEFRFLQTYSLTVFSKGCYLTENKFFSQTIDDKLVYWDLLDNGKSIFHNERDTNNKVQNGFFNSLGVKQLGNVYYAGDSCISIGEAPGYHDYWDKITIRTKEYENLKFNDIAVYIGTDKKGLSYYKFNPDLSSGYEFDSGIPYKESIIVLDPWTHEAYINDLQDGALNPARNENGLIALCGECIDSFGNVYFSDCNKEKQQYEIKKLNNEWLKQFDFFNREIGRMNSNHIELYKALSRESGFDGYNFDHEYLWILEHGKEWSKVRKVDGREGWVENKYISFTDEQRKNKENIYSPVFNSKIAKNQIMTVSENLRLRKTELSSSDIITTMKAGTKVKIVELGRIEQIDNRTEYWVKVEVLAGGKDCNDNPISGTIGWCFGGYLK